MRRRHALRAKDAEGCELPTSGGEEADGGETPATGTPPTGSRSLSPSAGPSSDGGDAADCGGDGEWVAEPSAKNLKGTPAGPAAEEATFEVFDGSLDGSGATSSPLEDAGAFGEADLAAEPKKAKPEAEPAEAPASKSSRAAPEGAAVAGSAAGSTRGSRKARTKVPGQREGGAAAMQRRWIQGPACRIIEAKSSADRRIIEVLAAPAVLHKRLVQAARRVPEVLADVGETLTSCCELYGSLALDMGEPRPGRDWVQDWASYYVNGKSDVDFVVEMKPGVSPSAVSKRLLQEGAWRMVGQVQVHKFASTQFTLLGSFGNEDEESSSSESSAGGKHEVYLDITCVQLPMHFARFKKRQEAFRKVFSETRLAIEGQFGAPGALAFDAYIHLLKAFAGKVPGNALTGFQATCIGLFTLQIGDFRMKPTHSLALNFFEGFLRFCMHFYGETPRMNEFGWAVTSYQQYAIDLSQGRWLPRQSTTWSSELYFMSAEVQMKTKPHERVNVAHSIDPAVVATEAFALLNRAFTGSGTFTWDAFSAPGAVASPVGQAGEPEAAETVADQASPKPADGAPPVQFQ